MSGCRRALQRAILRQRLASQRAQRGPGGYKATLRSLVRLYGAPAVTWPDSCEAPLARARRRGDWDRVTTCRMKRAFRRIAQTIYRGGAHRPWLDEYRLRRSST